MDFSIVTENIELILGFSIGGVSVITIVLAVVKVIKWLKHNTLEKALKKFTDMVIGKDINIDVTALVKEEMQKILDSIQNQLNASSASIIETQNAQNAVLTDLADIQLKKKTTLSTEQINLLTAHTDSIRTHEAAPAKKTISVTLKPIEPTVSTETEKIIQLD